MFTISLSTTSADWNTLSLSPTQNIGADDTQVFSGNLDQPWAFGDTLSIAFSTPFTYDPSEGNLLVNMFTPHSGSGDYNAAFDANGFDNWGYDGNQIFGTWSSYTVRSGYGLVTGFDTGGTPEPATLALLSAGLAGVALLRKRIRR
jgi:hypothetical protein